jgi:hypothetical protein
MTNIANKHGLRAAATERRYRHAQHPMAGLSKAARDAIREQNIAELLEESPSAKYGMMTVAQLKAEAKKMGLVTYTLRTKGALMNAILARLQTTPAQEARAEAKVDATFSDHEPPVTAAVAVEENKRRKNSADYQKSLAEKAKAAKAAAAVAPVEVEEQPLTSKSGVKANRFADKAEKLGWRAQLHDSQTTEDRVLCLATRANDGKEESITIEWIDGVFLGETCYQKTPGGRLLKLRNASHCLKRMALSAVDVTREDTKVGLHRATRPAAGTAGSGTPTARAPYFAEDVSDAEVLASVAGKSITWINAISGALESDRVSGATGDPVKIKTSASGRAVTFLGSAGFRTVRVSSIVSL